MGNYFLDTQDIENWNLKEKIRREKYIEVR